MVYTMLIQKSQDWRTHRKLRYYHLIAPTLDTGMQIHTLTEDVKIRRLTPKECERLQGFPDDWTSQSTNGAVSDSQRYKMAGNAVTTNVVQAVMEKLLW